jgi:hypothetical protein
MVSLTETKGAEGAPPTPSERAAAPVPPAEAVVSDSTTMRAPAGSRSASTPTLSPETKAALERGASQLAGALGTGLRAASRSLEASSPGALEALLEEAPELDLAGGDPLAARGARLAAESDFWQRLALRSLQRVVGADRASYALVAAGLAGALGLGVVAAIGALFPGAHPGTRAAMLALGGFALLVAVLSGYVFTDTVRRAQQDTARRAQENAARVERHLTRVALLVAQRRVDPDAHRASLAAWLDDGRTAFPSHDPSRV